MKFVQPAWLILLILLPLLGAGALLTARLRRRQWAAFVAPRLRETLLKRGSPLPRWFALVFLLAACAAIIIALARPQADAGTRTEKSLGRNVLIALDLSRSMRVQDVKPDRLAQAKLIIYELLEAMPNERIGLIGFAGDSYLYAPLTVDHSAVRETVQQVDETWAPLGGSNLASALRLGIDTLKKTGQHNNALVILSDGEKHEGNLEDMISEAEQSGVYILAIGVGTEDGDYVPQKESPSGRMMDSSGKPVLSCLQPEVMRSLATRTKGRYAVAGTGLDIPGLVKDSVKELDAFEVEGRERHVTIEFYQWLLLPAILFLIGSIIAGTRWKGVQAALLLAGAFLTTNSARADAVSAAKESLEAKRYPEARMAYRELAEKSSIGSRKARFRLGEATAAYRGGDFNYARSAYSKAMLSEEPEVIASSHLGMGNTLFQLGWKNLTENSYPNDPGKLPDLAAFEDIVKARLAKIKEEEDAESAGYGSLDSLVTDWADAVRHFDSASSGGTGPNAQDNRKLAMTYLKRLRELLEEDQKQTEQSMPQAQPGQGEPKEGDEGEGDKQKEGKDGKDGPKQPGGKGGEEKKPDDGSGGDKDKKKDDPGKKNEDKKKDKRGNDPNESPEDRARRILKENADLEKGPLSPGKREFRDPEKDW